MPSSVVQRLLLKICEEGEEVSVGLSDFIISGTAHGGGEPRKAAGGHRGPGGGAEALGPPGTDHTCSRPLGPPT